MSPPDSKVWTPSPKQLGRTCLYRTKRKYPPITILKVSWGIHGSRRVGLSKWQTPNFDPEIRRVLKGNFKVYGARPVGCQLH